MILRFLSEDKKDSVDCKGLCYGEILMLQARILSSENWFWQVITDEYLTVKDIKSIEWDTIPGEDVDLSDACLSARNITLSCLIELF